MYLTQTPASNDMCVLLSWSPDHWSRRRLRQIIQRESPKKDVAHQVIFVRQYAWFVRHDIDFSSRKGLPPRLTAERIRNSFDARDLDKL